MKVVGLHHGQVSIPSGSEDKVRKFYCEFLGFEESAKPDSLKGRGGVWVQLGNAQVHFGVEDGVDRSATRAHLAYEVTEVHLWREKFRLHGIEILDGFPIPGHDRFEFRDPFGNRVEFIERVGFK